MQNLHLNSIWYTDFLDIPVEAEKYVKFKFKFPPIFLL